MNLQKLFETQKILDDRIIEQHGLEGQDLLAEKIIALQVELAELAQEWRGFKFWSKDQKPRTSEKIECSTCVGTGDSNAEANMEQMMEGNTGYPYEACEDCGETGIAGYRNPLLEEYVDCLHFILSIGLEIQVVNLAIIEPFIAKSGLVQQFNVLFKHVGGMKIQLEADWHAAHKKYVHIVSLFAGLGEMLGFTWEQIEQAYYDKNKINHTRQATGY